MPALVSVIIPTYNRKTYVQEAIDSVLAQTYTHHEIIVIDDGSTDGTGEELQARYGDRIYYEWQENQGESVARNRGIELAQGEYIALLDSDDYWHPDKLAEQVSYLDQNPDVAFVFCQAWIIDESGQRVDLPPMSNNLTEEDLTLERMCLVNHVGSGGSTVVMRKSVLSFVGGFDVSIQYGEDWDLWLRMMRTHNCAFVAEPLAYIRRHTSAQHLGITQERLEQALSEHLHLLDKAFDSWPGVLPDDLRERSFAYRYAVFAIRGYLAGHLEWGRAKLAQAIQLYPEHWTEAERFSTLFFNELFLRVQTGQIDVRRAEKCILAVFARLPQFLDLPSDHKSEKLAEFYATVLFGSSKARDWARVRYCLPRLIWHDPSWLQNRGIWSIATEAFLGKGIADGLRRLV